MKKIPLTLCLLICAVLAASLLFSVVALVGAKSNAAALLELADELEARADQLEAQNHSLKVQLSSLVSDSDTEFCSLIVDSWSAEKGVLTIGAFAQAVLPENVTPSAQIELWHNNALVASHPVSLAAGEAEGYLEADADVAFHIPDISTGEELQLWLIVSTDSKTLFFCGSGWYLEDGQLMLITG